MSKFEKFLTLNLQLFGEGAGDGGDGGTGDAGATGGTVADAVPQKQAEKNPLANVKYGIQDEGEKKNPTGEGEVKTPDRNATFENLIKGEYKDLYDARVKDIVEKRLKNTKEAAEKYNSLTPMLEILSKKYGVEASDTEALTRAIEDDDAYYEQEAVEKGVTVAQLKEIKKMERENEELKKQMQEQSVRDNANKIYARWLEQEDALKAVYPSFNLEGELQNPKFMELLTNNVDVRTAYEVIHKDEIIGSAMQFAVQQTKEKVANDIIANGARPRENGISSQSAAVVKSDVSQLSKEDREEIIRRVAQGEKIRF